MKKVDVGKLKSLLSYLVFKLNNAIFFYSSTSPAEAKSNKAYHSISFHTRIVWLPKKLSSKRIKIKQMWNHCWGGKRKFSCFRFEVFSGIVTKSKGLDDLKIFLKRCLFVSVIITASLKLRV